MTLVKSLSYRPNYEHFWQESIKDWSGNVPVRMVDDMLEEQFWAEAVQRRKNRQTDPYAEIIFEAIKKELNGAKSVVEIGPGWGNYTFPLADVVKQLTCVDSSQAMLHYLKDCFEESGKEHISYMHAKWETIPHIEPHDVILGINCFYRMWDIKKALANMNKYARSKVIIGMTSGPIQPHYHLLEEKYGYDIKHPRRDYIDLLNILYEMGIFANCEIVPLERTYRYDSLDALVDAQSKKLLNKQFGRNHVEEALRDFVVVEDGVYCYRHDFHAALISWKPNHDVGIMGGNHETVNGTRKKGRL